MTDDCSAFSSTHYSHRSWYCGAKVILMNWRSFEEWGRSLEGFVTPFLLECVFQHALQSSVMVLPWAALYHVLDPLSGGRIQRLLRTGGPPICQVQDAYLTTWLRSVSMRRITSRYFTGIGFMPTSKDMYDRIFQRIKDQVPPGNLLEW